MSVSVTPTEGKARGKRADAERNRKALLDAAAAMFVRSGVDAPIRAIAAEAGVGIATVYRHFPTRAELVVAVYDHQIEACVVAGPELLARSSSPIAALALWVDLFVDFLVTKHGLAGALGSDETRFSALQTRLVERLVPVCGTMLDAAAAAGEIADPIEPFQLMYGVGNLCVNHNRDTHYDPRRLAQLLILGLSRGEGDF